MNKHAVLDDIKSKLIRIFRDRYNIDLSSGDEGSFSKELMGKEIRLLPRDLLYLFFDVEREFGIQIPEGEIINGNFRSINSIIGIIERQMNKEVKVG
ncbi:MAG: peptide maturation system acyl carrier-related protein [Bacillota bacterium]